MIPDCLNISLIFPAARGMRPVKKVMQTQVEAPELARVCGSHLRGIVCRAVDFLD